MVWYVKMEIDDDQLLAYIEQRKQSDPDFAKRLSSGVAVSHSKTATGRPSKLTKSISPFLAAIRRGMGYRASSDVAGISYQTFLTWRNRGEEELARLEKDEKANPRLSEVPYVDFVQQLRTAEGQGEFVLADVLHKGAVGGQVIKETRRIEILENGEVVKEVVQTTEKELPPDLRSAQFVLERRKEGWQRKTSTEITGANGGPIAQNIISLDLEHMEEGDLENLIANLQRANGGSEPSEK